MEKSKLTKEKVEEISTNFSEIKIKLLQNRNSTNKEEVDAILNKLDTLNQEIQEQYSRINEAGDNNRSLMPELEKNIYTSIESFNNAFTKAGSLFKRQ